MDKIKIGTGDWIVVCDGRKALILENLGDRMFPNLHTKEVHEHPEFLDLRAGKFTARQGAPIDGRRAKLDRADRLA